MHKVGNAFLTHRLNRLPGLRILPSDTLIDMEGMQPLPEQPTLIEQ